MHPLIEAAVLLTGTYAYFVVFALLSADRVIFRSRRPTYRDGPRVSKILADDGTPITALHLRAPERRAILLYLHGNAEDLGDVLAHLEAMQARGYTVLAIDYRGYGTTPGRANESNVNADAATALHHLCDSEGVSPREVIVYGRSMGGGPAVEIATREPVGGLVLEGAFVSAFRVVTGIGILPCDRFRNIEKLPNVRCPLLLIHGEHDRTIPFSHANRLLRVVQSRADTLWVPGAGHNDLVHVAGESYWDALAALADKARRAVEAT